jgi:hypothetical protein
MPRRSTPESARDFRPGPIGWVRRRILPLLARGSALLGVLVLGAWITGRVLTDQHHWSQYLWWIPPIWAVGAGWVLLLASFIFAKLARRSGGLFLRPILLLLVVGTSLYVPLFVWNMQRTLGSSTDKAPGSIRVLHWNQAAYEIDQSRWGQRIKDLEADIVLITNAEWGESRQTLLEQFAYFAPTENQRWINYSYRIHAKPAHYRVEGSAMIASRYPMVRTGMVQFGSAQRQQILEHSSSGRGWVMFIEFDVDLESVLDEPLIVWFIDLPSDPMQWKQLQVREAKAAIDAWDGRGWTMGRHVWEQTQIEPGPFPEPDLIVGDFNLIRGSDSIKALGSGYRDAFERVGYGRASSYTPKTNNPLLRKLLGLADWHIDLSLVHEDLKIEGYRLIEADQGPHAIQLLDVSRSNLVQQ